MSKYMDVFYKVDGVRKGMEDDIALLYKSLTENQKRSFMINYMASDFQRSSMYMTEHMKHVAKSVPKYARHSVENDILRKYSSLRVLFGNITVYIPAHRFDNFITFLNKFYEH